MTKLTRLILGGGSALVATAAAATLKLPDTTVDVDEHSTVGGMPIKLSSDRDAQDARRKVKQMLQEEKEEDARMLSMAASFVEQATASDSASDEDTASDSTMVLMASRTNKYGEKTKREPNNQKTNSGRFNPRNKTRARRNRNAGNGRGRVRDRMKTGNKNHPSKNKNKWNKNWGGGWNKNDDWGGKWKADDWLGWDNDWDNGWDNGWDNRWDVDDWSSSGKAGKSGGSNRWGGKGGKGNRWGGKGGKGNDWRGDDWIDPWFDDWKGDDWIDPWVPHDDWNNKGWNDWWTAPPTLSPTLTPTFYPTFYPTLSPTFSVSTDAVVFSMCLSLPLLPLY
jgi:hypothetical protein